MSGQTESRLYTVSVTRDVPSLGLRVGDVVIVEPDAPEPLALWRPLATNPRQLLAVLEEGAGELSPDLAFSEFAAVLQAAGSRRLALVP